MIWSWTPATLFLATSYNIFYVFIYLFLYLFIYGRFNNVVRNYKYIVLQVWRNYGLGRKLKKVVHV
jgi:hypothetical protein